jgi:hypothetical protein
MHEGGTHHSDLSPDPVPGRTRLPLGGPDRIAGRKSEKTMHRPGLHTRRSLFAGTPADAPPKSDVFIMVRH